MSAFVDRVRLRLIPALLTAVGVGLLAVGLLSYSNPVHGRPTASASRRHRHARRSAVADAEPADHPPAARIGPAPSVERADRQPTAVPRPPDRVATRVRIAALEIDLPVMVQPDPRYPACNVAMYLPQLWQPGWIGASTSTRTPGPGCSCRSSTRRSWRTARRCSA